jgi:hypothetical protein
MAAFTAFDNSDSDFGYDFSPEEERLLIQLASANHNPAPVLRDFDDAASVIDSVPGKTDSVAGDHAATFELDGSVRAQPVHDGQTTSTGLPALESAAALPSPLSLNEDISYPDRKWQTTVNKCRD